MIAQGSHQRLGVVGEAAARGWIGGDEQKPRTARRLRPTARRSVFTHRPQSFPNPCSTGSLLANRAQSPSGPRGDGVPAIRDQRCLHRPASRRQEGRIPRSDGHHSQRRLGPGRGGASGAAGCPAPRNLRALQPLLGGLTAAHTPRDVERRRNCRLWFVSEFVTAVFS